MLQVEHNEAIEKRLRIAAYSPCANFNSANNKYFLSAMDPVFLSHAYISFFTIKTIAESSLLSPIGKIIGGMPV
jgi:hypothetical protein